MKNQKILNKRINNRQQARCPVCAAIGLSTFTCKLMPIMSWVYASCWDSYIPA